MMLYGVLYWLLCLSIVGLAAWLVLVRWRKP